MTNLATRVKPKDGNEVSLDDVDVLDGFLVVGLRPIVRLWDLGLQGACPSWGSF